MHLCLGDTDLSSNYFVQFNFRPITVKALNVICSSVIIGDPKPFYDPTIYEDDSDEYDSDEDDSDELSQNEDALAPTQKCSCSETQSNKKIKLQSEIAKDISRIAEMMMEKNKENDMGACFEKLENIGWGREGSMYDTAVLLFDESADYRKVWLHLKPESCEKWVKNAGSKFCWKIRWPFRLILDEERNI